jgi:DNA repair protein RadC
MALGKVNSIGDFEIPVVRVSLVRDYSIPFEKVSALTNTVRVLHAMLDDSPVEQFVCLHVSADGNMVGAERIAVGDLEMVHVGMRNLFRGAMLSGASDIIVGHNHPSGNPDPSDQDIVLTGSIVSAAMLIGMHLIDHVIVSPRGNHFSIIENEKVMLQRLNDIQIKSLLGDMLPKLPLY